MVSPPTLLSIEGTLKTHIHVNSIAIYDTLLQRHSFISRKFILNSKNITKTKHCLVKWKAFPGHENTWEPSEDLLNAHEAAASYLASI